MATPEQTTSRDFQRRAETVVNSGADAPQQPSNAHNEVYSQPKVAKPADTAKDAALAAEFEKLSKLPLEKRLEFYEKMNKAAAEQMEEVKSHLREARKLLANGYDAALPEYEKAVEIADSKADPAMVFTMRKLNSERSQKLDEEIKKTKKGDPLYAGLVNEQKAMLQFEETLKDLQRASSFTRANQGMAMIRDGQVTEGKKLVDKAAAMDDRMLKDANFQENWKALWQEVDATNPQRRDLKVSSDKPGKTTDAPQTVADVKLPEGNNRPGTKEFVDPFDQKRLEKIDNILAVANALEQHKGKADTDKVTITDTQGKAHEITVGVQRQNLLAFAKTVGVEATTSEDAAAKLRQVAKVEMDTAVKAADTMDRTWLGQEFKKAQTEVVSTMQPFAADMKAALANLKPEQKVMLDGLDAQIKAAQSPEQQLQYEKMKLAVLFPGDAQKQQAIAGAMDKMAALAQPVARLEQWNDSSALTRMQLAQKLDKYGQKEQAAQYLQEVPKYNPAYLQSEGYKALLQKVGVAVPAVNDGKSATDKNVTQPAATNPEMTRADAGNVSDIADTLKKAKEAKTPEQSKALYEKAIAQADSPEVKAQGEALVQRAKAVLDSGKNQQTGADLTDADKQNLAMIMMAGDAKTHAPYLARMEYAQALIESKDYAGALRQMDAAVAKDPEYAKTLEQHLTRAQYQQAMGQVKNAETEYKQAIAALDKQQVSQAQYDENVKSLKAQLDAAGDVNSQIAARQKLDAYNELVSAPSVLRQNVARFYMQNGKFDEADAMFKEARKLDVTKTAHQRVISEDPETKQKITAEVLEKVAGENTTEKVKARGGLAGNVLKDIGVNLGSGWTGLAVSALIPEERMLTRMLAGWGAASATHYGLSQLSGLETSAMKSLGMGAINQLAGQGGLRVAKNGMAAFESGLEKATYANLGMAPERMAGLGLNKLQIAELSMAQEEMAALKAVANKVAPRFSQIRIERQMAGADVNALNAESKALYAELQAAVPERLRGLGLSTKDIVALQPKSGLERLDGMKALMETEVGMRKELADQLAASHASVAGTKPFRLPFMPEEMPQLRSSMLNPFNAFKSVDQASNFKELQNIAAMNRFRVDAQAIGVGSFLWNAPQQYAKVANGEVNAESGQPMTVFDATVNSGKTALYDGMGGAFGIAGLRKLGPFFSGVASRLAGNVPEIPVTAGPGLVETHMPAFYRWTEAVGNNIGKVTQPIKSAGYNYLAKPTMNAASGGYNWMMGDGAFRTGARNAAFLFLPTDRVLGTGIGSAVEYKMAQNTLAAQSRPLENAPITPVGQPVADNNKDCSVQVHRGRECNNTAPQKPVAAAPQEIVVPPVSTTSVDASEVPLSID